MNEINSLVVKKIKTSIKVMDEFEVSDYDFLELENWFWVLDSKDRHLTFSDNTGKYYVSLMVSKERNRNKKICKFEPTMTELRKMQHHGIMLDENYETGSIDQIIRDACKVWKKDKYIELDSEICLRAQTSWNRTDFGCEWIGGGGWEEKTLYGETTDFFITGIILREPYKSIEQEAREILLDLENRYAENLEFIESVMKAFKHIDQPVIHKQFGEGFISEIVDNKIRVSFSKNTAMFICPDSILLGFFTIPEHNEVIQVATEKWNENISLLKKIRNFRCSIESNDYKEIYYAVREFQKD